MSSLILGSLLAVAGLVLANNISNKNKEKEILRREKDLLESSLINSALDIADLKAELSPKREILPSDEEITKGLKDINFEEKYLKYKEKYLNLKKNYNV
jgi:hypothetical protein